MKYQTKGVCSSHIDIEVENGVIKFVEFENFFIFSYIYH